jgi:hypothetical protein
MSVDFTTISKVLRHIYDDVTSLSSYPMPSVEDALMLLASKRGLVQECEELLPRASRVASSQALDIAVNNRDLDLITFFLQEGVDLIQGDTVRTLEELIIDDRLDILRQLTEAEAMDSTIIQDVFRVAVVYDRYEILRYYLIEHHCFANEALPEAVLLGKMDMIKFLVEEVGVDVNILSSQQKASCLEISEDKGFDAIAMYLVAHGATRRSRK